MVTWRDLFFNGGGIRGDVVIGLGAREVEEELRLGFEFVLDSREGAEKSLAKVSEDGGASSGNAVLDKKHGELGEKIVNAASGLESREQFAKSR